MSFAAGMQVTPSVRLLRPLGAGGMGAVWVAEHLTLHTEVVVKFMSTELALDQSSVLRFSREASAAAAVKSPHVVQMLDHGVTTDGSPFIVMELLEGEDLRHRLNRQRVLPLGDVLEIMGQVCKALSRAHAAGIVHRDIKPDNIFLCRADDGEVFVKLLDFGIAKKGDVAGMGATKTGALMGTPYYMSPEQALGLKEIDFRTDLWSLGVVAFEAMTGTRPFEGESVGALAIAVCHGPMPTLSRVAPHLPPALDQWFARACAREAPGRFSSAREMGDALYAAITAATLGATVNAAAVVTPSVAASAPRPSSGVGLVTTNAPIMSVTADTSKNNTTKVALAGALVLFFGLCIAGWAYVKGSTKPPTSPASSVEAPPSVSVAIMPSSTPLPVTSSQPSAPTAVLVPAPPTVKPRASSSPSSAPSLRVTPSASPSASTKPHRNDSID